VALSTTIWDSDEAPPAQSGTVLLWRSYSEEDQYVSIPRYLEDHAEVIRAKYLAFIRDLGESLVNGKRVIDHLDHGDGLSYWWMTTLAEKNPLKSPSLSNCLRLLALEALLIEMKPSYVEFFSSNKNLGEAVLQLCINLKIACKLRLRKREREAFSLRRLYRSLPVRCQAPLVLLWHLVSRWSLRQLQKPHWFSGKNSILLCSYFIHLDAESCEQGRFYSRQWEALPHLLKEKKYNANWLQHFLFSPVVPNVSKGLEWLRRFNRDADNQGCHAFLDCYLTWRVVFQIVKRWIWLNAVGWRLRHVTNIFAVRGSAATFWPLLRNEWLASLYGPIAITNCLWSQLFDSALKQIPRQRMGLYLCEFQGWEMALLFTWRKYGHGAIFGVQHSTVPFWHLYNFNDPLCYKSQDINAMPMPDRLAVNGPHAWRAFAESGYPVEKMVEVEALRYFHIIKKRKKERPFDSANASIKNDLGKVLILGEMIPQSMHRLLSLIEETMRLHSLSYKFVIKPHPGCPVDISRYPGLHIETIDEALNTVLDRFDVAISGNSTSAAVEAYLVGLRVIIELSGNELNLSPLRGQVGVHFITSPKDLANALQLTDTRNASNSTSNDYFFLDNTLERWTQLLVSHS
jgi:surface carbohydrate biosynthesis protein (TIGR04326 family)